VELEAVVSTASDASSTPHWAGTDGSESARGTSLVPPLTAALRSAGAARSLELRQERACLKAIIAERGSPYLITFWPHDTAQGMKVYDLLRALPGVGPKKAQRLLDAAGIPAKNTVAACGPLQTERLFKALRDLGR
jgi:hypothetical protein